MPRALVGLSLLLLCCGPASSEERRVTDWLKIDVSPGTSGMIGGLGRQTFRARVGNTWKLIGSGHPCRYMLLAEGKTALIDLNDNKGTQIIAEGEERLRPLPGVFGRADPFLVVSGRAAIDFYDCRVPAKPAGCRDLRITRRDLQGKLVKTFDLVLKDAYPECQLLMAKGFDGSRTPYVNAQCAMSSASVKCLLVAARADGLFVHAVPRDRPWRECSDFPGLGVSLHPLELFEVFY